MQISLTQRIIRILSSNRFFWAIVGVFVAQALWIALTGRYPMAFDEDFHLGIIRLYASHAMPFWGGQPEGANAYGAIARDPSYLFHYLMSFPYMLVSAFTANQAVQVIVLRIINICLIAGSLPLYRRLLTTTGASKALANVCLAAFVLFPVVPLLAAQINYDNALLPLTAVVLLLAVSVYEGLREQRIKLSVLLWLVVACMFTSLVKYAFLPMAIATVVFLLVYAAKQLGTRSIWPATKRSWAAWRGYSKPLAIALFCLLAILCFERYALNIVRYHKPVVECSQVLDIDACQAYGPWARDYKLAQDKAAGVVSSQPDVSPLRYIEPWLYGMWLRSFFAVDGPLTNFQTRGPLLVPAIGAIVWAVASVAALLCALRRLMRLPQAPVLILFGSVIAAYIVALLSAQYQSYVRTGQPVAVNGRYLAPIFPMVLVIVGLAWRELLGRMQVLKIALAGCVIVSLLWGGGALTYILRSSDAWYWPSPYVRAVNHAVQRVAGPLTPGYDKPTQFLR